MNEGTSSRVPPLSHYCHKAILSHIDAFDGFGSLDLDLYRPILPDCSATTLLRLERNTPGLEVHTRDCWQDLCKNEHRTEYLRIIDQGLDPPDCWRTLYFDLKEQERQRLEEVGTRVRGQRQEAEVKKRERQTIFVEPIVKRARTSSKHASLFDQTRRDSIKLARNVFGPTKPVAPKVVKPRHPVNSLAFTTPPTIRASSSKLPSSSPFLPSSPPPKVSPPLKNPTKPLISPTNKPSLVNLSPKKALTPITPPSSKSTEVPRLLQQPLPAGSKPTPHSPNKKDPLASVFMPKHRAHSQLQPPQSVGLSTSVRR